VGLAQTVAGPAQPYAEAPDDGRTDGRSKAMTGTHNPVNFVA
jgi:hypothetical protein